jgi:hypothetical protein
LLRTGITLARKFNFKPASMKRILILQNSGQDHFVTDMWSGRICSDWPIKSWHKNRNIIELGRFIFVTSTTSLFSDYAICLKQ